jgi:hypothetical protein
MDRFGKYMASVVLAVVLAVGAGLYLRSKLINPHYIPLTVSDSQNGEVPENLHEPPPINFVETNMSSAKRRAFLAADYKILRSVAELPEGIRRAFTAKGDTRIAMADPGEQFQYGDVIVDETMPRRRLIFAGVSGDRAFVHYEEGGIGRFLVLDFFRLQPPEIAVGTWEGYCDQPARSFDDLRNRLTDGRCHP